MALQSAWGSGEVFPLPLPFVEPPARADLSRGVVQRVGRRRRQQLMAHGAVEALNWLAGCQHGGEAGLPNSSCQREALNDIGDAIAAFSDAPVLNPAEAARALLHEKTGYSGGPPCSTLRSFDPRRVASPADTRTAPLTSELLAGPERLLFEELTAKHRRTSLELAGIPEARPYLDPALRHSRKKYSSFVRSLAEKGIICWMGKKAM